MDDETKDLMEKIFVNHCIMLSEVGSVIPIFFIIVNRQITPIILSEDMQMDFEKYATFSIKAADQMDASAMILVSEQYMVMGKDSDKDMKALLTGEIKPSEHPNKLEYLSLTYMEAHGKAESLYGKIEKDPTGLRFVREQTWADGVQTTQLMPWR